ncbi:MAG: 3-oxoacyl-ACP reductase family protein [archaeon]|nr:3-oxoacyl-ACP reductase family protein [archaeon]
MRFKNKVAIVTGSSRGIGRATALLFAKEGAKVVVNFFNSEKEANNVVNEIKKLGSEAIAIKCDVSKEQEVKRMVEETIKKFGRIDILVNNAAIVLDIPFMEKTVEQWQRTIEVDLFGTFLCCKYVIPQMKKQKSGKIVNIASTNGIDTVSPESVDYDATKAGIIVFTKALARDLAPTIYVNSVSPGWVDTEMNSKLPKQVIKEETERISVKRFGKPEEIGNAILFLASDDASFITGSNLVVDGGYK